MPDPATERTDVVVVGAGPTGMTVGALLGQQGVSTLVLEQGDTICAHPRAQAIDDESMRTMQSIGFARRFLKLTRLAEGSRYYDANGNCFGEIGRGPENFGFPKRNYMLQQQLDEMLFDTLDNLGDVETRFSTRVSSIEHTADGVLVHTDTGARIAANYVVACDGGQSATRTAAGIKLTGQTYEKKWIVLDNTNDPDTDAISKFFCDPSRPHVSIASPQGGRRYEWMLRDGESDEEVLTDAFLGELLAPFGVRDLSGITRRAVYTFHSRIAERLRDRRVLWLGDAAHLSPPFAGQGMNAGIRDAHNVAWKVAGVVRHGWSDTVLDSYEAERREPIWAMIQLAVAMGEFVMPMGEEQVGLTRSVMQALERFPEAHDWLFQMKFKPKPRYTTGVFLDLDDQAYEASLVGEMLPQPSMIASGAMACQLDDLLGKGFALIAQDDAGERALEQAVGGVWEELRLSAVRIHAERRQMEDAVGLPTVRRACFAGDGYERPLRTHRDQVLLVRPDRYVLAAFEPADLSTVGERLAALLH